MNESPPPRNTASALQTLLAEHAHQRVVVVGTTCTGKSTLLAQIPEGRDMDKLVFPKLSEAEAAYVCQTPWTEEIGSTMTRLVRERVAAEPGRPAFGTVVIDADLIVVLKISDSLLKQRIKTRGVKFTDAKNMQAKILRQVQESGIPFVEFSVG